MLRVHYKELDSHPDDGGCCTLRGEPFTGVAFDVGQNGQVDAEWSFRDGKQWGPQCAWYPDGQLARSHYVVAGFTHGVNRSWRLEGRKSSVKLHQYGITVRAKFWDEQGRVFKDYTLESELQADWYLGEIQRRKEKVGALVAAEPIPDEFSRVADEDWQ